MRVKAFDWFLNDKAEVLRITESGAYKKTKETEVLGSLDCDIQPYSGKLATEEYGYNVECDKKMYYQGKNEGITAGGYIKTGGILYQIQYVTERKLGSMALLKRVTCND